MYSENVHKSSLNYDDVDRYVKLLNSLNVPNLAAVHLVNYLNLSSLIYTKYN